MSVILVGMPGCGKTTVLDLYEKTYGEQVYDTDCFIESRHGEISKIFAEYGEEYFRDLETQAVREICGFGDASFIATGGGCVLREENVRLLKNIGKIVYLRTQPETLIKRLESDTKRPLLSGDKRERILKLFTERSPIYEGVADIIIDTDGLSPKELLEKIFAETAVLRGRG